MEARTHAVRWWALWVCLTLVPVALFGAENPPATSPADFDQLLSQGYDLEHSGRWSRAIQLYEDAKKAHPNSLLLRQRLRQCEIRYGLSRRYHDASFRSKLLALPRGQSLKLFDEVSQKIDDYYVESPEHTKLLRNGIENLLVACEDEDFQKANLSGVAPDRIVQFRDRLRSWKTAAARNRAEAHQYVVSVTDLAEKFLGVKAAPVILEFIYGACDALDDYSAYLTPDRLGDLYAVIDGNFVGIGVELRSDDDGLLVVNSLVGGPAAEARIRKGDHIVAVGSVPTVGLSTEEAANLLQGAEGSSVELWVLSAGASAPRRVVLKRRPVEVQSVSASAMISPAEGIGYIQLTGFQKSTVSELQQAVARLEQQAMRSLILDLRGNPGGLLTAAVDASDKFLSDGVIVSTRGRAEGQSVTYRAHRANTWTFPLVVLIDGDSASASEILAGAIQDNGRGTLVGVRTYGKGSVQSIFPLDSADAGIRLTTAKFFSPNGRAYSHQGVNPDIEVAWDTVHPPADPSGPLLNPAHDAQLAAAIRASRQLLGRKN